MQQYPVPYITSEKAALLHPGAPIKILISGRWMAADLWFEPPADGSVPTRSTIMWIRSNCDLNGSDSCPDPSDYRHSLVMRLRELDQRAAFHSPDNPFPGPEDIRLASDRPRGDAAPSEVCQRCGRGHAESRVITADGVQAWCPECASAHATVCAHCGRRHTADSGDSVDGEDWCVWCMDAEAVFCDRCRTWHRWDNSALVISENNVLVWCRPCATDHATVCQRCGDLIPRDSSAETNGEPWCRPCVNAFTRVCEDCGSRATDCENLDGRTLCPACLSRRPPSGFVFRYHGYKGSLTFHKTDLDTEEHPLYMGFELEAGGTDAARSGQAAETLFRMDTGFTRFHTERDGSIPQFGFELISMPHTLEAHRQYQWKEVLKVMRSAGMLSHDAPKPCGLHVHVSRNFLPLESQACLDLFIMNNRTFWETLARRTETSYARFLYKDAGEAGRESGRYSALNLGNADTIEFRLFRGTLRFSTFFATLELVDAVCRWIRPQTLAQIATQNERALGEFIVWLNSNGPDRYRLARGYIAARFGEGSPLGSLATSADRETVGALVADEL